jgi:type IV secretory pathway VirB9-like protein
MHRITGLVLILIFGSTLAYSDDLTAAQRQNVNKLSKSAPSIYKLTAKTGVVYKLQTAVGFVTTIELPSEALKVYVGDQDLFAVETYGNEVIIKPATDYSDARSNITVYTDETRLSFDISVGPPETADFVLDFHYPTDEAMVENEFKKRLDEKKSQLEAGYQEELKKQDEKVKMLSEARFAEALKAGARIKRFKISKQQGGIRINLLSLSQIGPKYYLQISVVNNSQADYSVERIVLGKEIYKRSGFGQAKDGFIPVDFNQNVDSPIAKGTTRFGLISFDKIALNANEKLVLRVYENGKTDPIEISQVPAEV